MLLESSSKSNQSAILSSKTLSNVGNSMFQSIIPNPSENERCRLICNCYCSENSFTFPPNEEDRCFNRVWLKFFYGCTTQKSEMVPFVFHGLY